MSDDALKVVADLLEERGVMKLDREKLAARIWVQWCDRALVDLTQAHDYGLPPNEIFANYAERVTQAFDLADIFITEAYRQRQLRADALRGATV